MTAKLARQQSYTHLSNFTGALVLLPNIDHGYGASSPYWKPQGEIREFLSDALFKHAGLASGWLPLPIGIPKKLSKKQKQNQAQCIRGTKSC